MKIASNLVLVLFHKQDLVEQENEKVI